MPGRGATKDEREDVRPRSMKVSRARVRTCASNEGGGERRQRDRIVFDANARAATIKIFPTYLRHLLIQNAIFESCRIQRGLLICVVFPSSRRNRKSNMIFASLSPRVSRYFPIDKSERRRVFRRIVGIVVAIKRRAAEHVE